MLMSIELMLNAVNLAIVAFGAFIPSLQLDGAIIALMVMAVAAAGTDWGAVGEATRVVTRDLANLLFDNYVLAFEAVSVLLLAAVIGGVFLAKREKDPA
jgi:NADH:ubiquinone oxidoreductase subunit 6 (subunit J)